MSIHRRNIRGLCLAGTALAGALALMTAPAYAQEQRFELDVPSQRLDTALRAFAQQTHQQLMFAVGDTKGFNAPALNGSYSADEAIGMLVAGTGLKVHRNASGVFLIEAASDPQSGGAAGDGADQGTVQALIVTAQKREEDIQDVPIAISAFTQEDLTRSQVAGGADLMTQVPNMTFTKTNFSSYSIQIRGIGTQAISATVDPAVAVAFNNTPFIANRFFEQEFYDLERVEVLRGPQGTLYGRNATAGVVNIISAKPKNHFEAKLSADIANYESTRIEGMVNIPLVEDKAALRIAGAWTKRAGFVTNTIEGDQTDGRDLWSSRITLGLTPTEWFAANVVYERFEEDDDRLRSGKQLCHRDPGPSEINGVPILETGDPVFAGPAARVYWTSGCRPSSLYSPDAFETPNGFALPYATASGLVGAPVHYDADPYVSTTQSRSLREIETRVTPQYQAAADIVELQLHFDLPKHLTLASETGFGRDHIFSFQDFNRFNTKPGLFIADGSYPSVSPGGVVCDPQLGCSDRLTAADLSTGDSLQFSQEFRLSSAYDGPINFSAGANFLRYDTEAKYYVFFNTLGAATIPDSDSKVGCLFRAGNSTDKPGYAWSTPTRVYGVIGFGGCTYADVNDIHHLNDEGRNYFLSKNPYHLLSYAAFGEIYYQITPQVKLTAGYRWTKDDKTAPQIPSWLLAAGTYGTATLKVIEQEWNEPTGRLAIDWKPQLGFTDQTLVYASYVHGYKAGGANPPGYIVTGAPINFPFDAEARASLTHPETFKPEFVDSYEVGTKNTFLGGKLTFNLNGFYYNYKGYQISQIVDRSAVNLNFDTEIWGSELEAAWRPLENLSLGFKAGYQNSRMANGSRAIDLMDRTAGTPGWIVQKPFPTIPSSCIVPIEFALSYGCIAYKVPGLVPFDAPNNGEGFTKDLSGNELPNAPHYTATLTADFTLPLPNDWFATLHSDLYYQSEAWTRIFNTPGYDKLKAFNNVNLAAIFTNQDAGWTLMAYVKNAFNKDNITGAFLNSDDTGLTTNVFLNEPRLYGLRVTKQWSDGKVGGIFGGHVAGEPYLFRLETSGYYGEFSQSHEHYAPPIANLFAPDFPMPTDAQSDLDHGGGGSAKLTYTPSGEPWSLSASVRYGRALGHATPHAQVAPGVVCVSIFDQYDICTDPGTGHVTRDGQEVSYYRGGDKYNFYDASSYNQEAHLFSDFMVGRDFGIGSMSDRVASSKVSAGLALAHIDSSADLVLHVRPDLTIPDDLSFPQPPPIPLTHLHRLNAEMHASREFNGAGPALSWTGTIALVGSSDQAGQLSLDAGVGGAVLFGRQSTKIREHKRGAYTAGAGTSAANGDWSAIDLSPPYDTTLEHRRSTSVTVPSAAANLGLLYEVGRLQVGGGYRWEQYFGAIDAGVEKRETFDREFSGPYFKASVGFGG